MEELIRRNPRRNSTPVPNDITQVWSVTYTTCKNLPLRGTETVKPHPHHGASRPANPLVTLEDRTQEIFYQDVHALLPPPPPPPLPSGSGPVKIDDLRGLYGRGKSAERQQSQPSNPHHHNNLQSLKPHLRTPTQPPSLIVSMSQSHPKTPPNLEHPRQNKYTSEDLPTEISHPRLPNTQQDPTLAL